MDNDLISRSALIDAYKPLCDIEWNRKAAPVSWADAYEQFIDDLEAAPAVDAVEVVRCKDCKHRIKRKEFVYICKANGGFIRWGSNGFCCRGERRTE